MGSFIEPITLAEYQYLNELGIGFCRACGEERGQCEPDAEHYRCFACGEHEVFGLELLAVMGELEIVEEEP